MHLYLTWVLCELVVVEDNHIFVLEVLLLYMVIVPCLLSILLYLLVETCNESILLELQQLS